MNNKIINNYRTQDCLRHSFNELASITFDGLNFEAWYQNGYWGDCYNPYSIVTDNQVIANVSVNRMEFVWNGERKRFIQLGTVMTAEKYRNQGLIRRIMDEIDQDYGQTVDGVYLFANDSVLDFYPKFGFRQAEEYCYTKTFTTAQPRRAFSTVQPHRMVQAPMRGKKDWLKLENAMRQSVPYSRFHMTGNDSLIMFYITGFMQDAVYYDQEYDAYVIAETEGDSLIVHNIFAREKYPIDDILSAFGSDVKHVALGFTPMDAEGYSVSVFKEEDCTLFVKGSGFDGFERDRVMFPTLSHA